MSLAGFFELGWMRFASDPRLESWLDGVRERALATRHDPANADWLRCGGTWFVGVNALANDGAGEVAGSGPLEGDAIGFVRRHLGFSGDLDRAQVSIIYPGYPLAREGESEAAFAFRRDRDAAHVDGLHPVGPDRRRKVEEFQGFLLGLPVTEADEGASPLVVWEGSHRLMADMFRKALGPRSPEDWPEVDLTAAYHAARREVFARCPRRVVHARPGEAYLLHRFALHGVSPWQDGARADRAGRAILYFRPEIAREAWLTCE